MQDIFFKNQKKINSGCNISVEIEIFFNVQIENFLYANKKKVTQ
jgi:hypothetical protein